MHAEWKTAISVRAIDWDKLSWSIYLCPGIVEIGFVTSIDAGFGAMKTLRHVPHLHHKPPTVDTPRVDTHCSVRFPISYISSTAWGRRGTAWRRQQQKVVNRSPSRGTTVTWFGGNIWAKNDRQAALQAAGVGSVARPITQYPQHK